MCSSMCSIFYVVQIQWMLSLDEIFYSHIIIVYLFRHFSE